MTRLEKWLEATATAQSNNLGKAITSDMVKLSCVSTSPAVPPYATRFDQFMNTFKQWQDKNYPPAGAPPGPETPGPATTAPPVEGAGTTQAPPSEGPLRDCFEHGRFEGDECPTCAQEKGKPPEAPSQEAISLEERRKIVWDKVIAQNIPLAALAVLDPPVSAPGHVIEQNISEAEELVATYKAPTGKAGK